MSVMVTGSNKIHHAQAIACHKVFEKNRIEYMELNKIPYL